MRNIFNIIYAYEIYFLKQLDNETVNENYTRDFIYLREDCLIQIDMI